jgi:hypothetical protein
VDRVRGRRAWLPLLLLCSRAVADPADPYSLPYPDRPIVLPCGVTELDVSADFRTQVVTEVDAMGNETTERTGFADDWNTYIGVGHTFRNVEVSLALGLRTQAAVAIDTFAFPTRIEVGGAFMTPQKDGHYNHSQWLNAQHRFSVLPGRLSIGAGVTATVTEARFMVDAMTVEGGVLSAHAGASAYVQLGWRLSMSAGVGVGAPLWESEGIPTQVAVGVATYLVLALRKWDFYVGGNLNDVTRSGPSTFFTFGVKKRWGL